MQEDYFLCVNEWYNTLFSFIDGYYIYLETSSGSSGSKAQLQSPNFNINRGQRKCLSLWFHMYGPNVGYLNVYLKKNGVLGRPIWRRNGNKGNQWRQGTINIPTSSNIQNAQVNINILDTTYNNKHNVCKHCLKHSERVYFFSKVKKTLNMLFNWAVCIRF